MMTMIESNVMVNPINDSGSFKRLDADSKLKHAQRIHDEMRSDETSEVNISDFSRQVAALKESILSAPEIDKSRVEFLKEELASGRYRIVSDHIALKMFKDIEMA